MRYTTWYNGLDFKGFTDLESAKTSLLWELRANKFEFYESAWIREYNDKDFCVAEYYWSQLPETLGWQKIEKQ